MKKMGIGLISLILALSLVTAVSADGGNYCVVDGNCYETMIDAVNGVGEGGTIEIRDNITNAVGVSVPSNKKFTIDFQNHTYTLAGPGAGSTSTETNGFQLLKDSTIVMKNGTINIAENPNNVKRIIQNYANLTLENMTFYSKNQIDGEDYALSFNNGSVVFKGNTSVITSSEDIIAFDVCKFSSYPSASVTFDDSYTGEIVGKVVYDSSNLETHKLTINGNGTFDGIELSNAVPSDNNASSAITINSGEFNDDVSEYVPEGRASIKADGNYYVGTPNDMKQKAQEATSSVEVLKGIDELSGIKPGVSVTNNSGDDIKVNGEELVDGESTNIKEPLTTSRPSTPSNPIDPCTERIGTGWVYDEGVGHCVYKGSGQTIPNTSTK